MSTTSNRKTPNMVNEQSIEKILDASLALYDGESSELAQKNQRMVSIKHWNQHLPASYRNKDQELRLPVQDVGEFLQNELSLARLNRIFNWLWLAGRPMPPRALHYQKFLGRNIVVVHKLDMHLLWDDAGIYVSPLPRYLLIPSFWRDNLSCQVGCNCSAVVISGPQSPLKFCRQQSLRRISTGLLYSYAGLIANDYDFEMAQDLKLLPKDITWPSFRVLLQGVLSIDLLAYQIDRRFVFGELRLNRLNMILRLKGFLEGYRMRYPNYAAFWSQNIQWVVAIIGYVLLVLTAMQVGLATSTLSNSDAFQAVSYGFTVLAIVGPLTLLFVVFLLLLFFVVYNLQRTRRFKAQQFEKLFRTDSER